MTVDSIKNGIVIDHIRAGRSMEIYNILNLDVLTCTVALIKNVPSRKMGRKDIIKIDSELQLNFDVLGYLDPGITVNLIKNGELSQKLHLELPEKVINVIKCKNPRCITSTEQELDQIFNLTDRDNCVYRCAYCESKAKNSD